MHLATSLTGGFEAPVLQSQTVFRGVMEAMARPGSLFHVTAEVAAPGSLGTAQAALALTLCDADTPVFLDALLAAPALADWLTFHTSARVTDDPAGAAFAFLALGGVPHGDFALGAEDYPDRSTTVVLEVGSLEAGERFLLAGPGIEGRREIAVKGLWSGFAAFRRRNRVLFPRGIDLILTCGTALMALPRSTRIIESEA